MLFCMKIYESALQNIGYSFALWWHSSNRASSSPVPWPLIVFPMRCFPSLRLWNIQFPICFSKSLFSVYSPCRDLMILLSTNCMSSISPKALLSVMTPDNIFTLSYSLAHDANITSVLFFWQLVLCKNLVKTLVLCIHLSKIKGLDLILS